jgi:hypothetical protein
MNAVFCYSKFIPSGEEPDARRALIIEIGVICAGATNKGKILDRADASVKSEITDHERNISQEWVNILSGQMLKR